MESTSSPTAPTGSELRHRAVTCTKVVSVSGCVKRPGNHEVELGVTLRDLIYGPAGGPLDGHEITAFTREVPLTGADPGRT